MSRCTAIVLALVTLVSCSDAKDARAPDPGARAWQPPAVAIPFRWSEVPLACQTSFVVRAGSDRCAASEGTDVVARPAGTAAKPTIEVEGHRRAKGTPWKIAVDVRQAVKAPVVAVIPAADVAVVAAATPEDVELLMVELRDGKLRGRGRIPVRGVTAIQLERRAPIDQLRVYMLHPQGGATAIADVITGSIVGISYMPTGALRNRMEPGATPADGEARVEDGGDVVWAGWDGDDLVVRATANGATAPRWQAVLAHSGGPFRSELVTLHVVAGTVVGTLHHPSASWTQGFAFALADGDPLWRETVTGVGPVAHSAYVNRVASRVDGGDLVVYGVESAGSYVCSLDHARGLEHACFDLDPGGVIDPGPPAHLPPPKEAKPRPLGPTATSVRCTAKADPATRLSVRRSSAVDLTGMITAPSESCKPELGGGIAGDRIELMLRDPGPPMSKRCECQINFRQDYRPESKTIIVSVDGKELLREPVPGWSP